MYICIHMYIYLCVCVCVCVCYFFSSLRRLKKVRDMVQQARDESRQEEEERVQIAHPVCLQCCSVLLADHHRPTMLSVRCLSWVSRLGTTKKSHRMPLRSSAA